MTWCQSTFLLCTSCFDLLDQVVVLDSEGFFVYISIYLNENDTTRELFRILCDSFANFLLRRLSCGV